MQIQQKPENIVREIFKSRGSPRKRISSIFSQMRLHWPLGPQGAAAKGLETYPAGIEIGSASVKVAQLARSGGSFEIVKCGYLSCAGAAPGAGAKSMRDCLEELVKQNKISGEVVTSLPINKIQALTFVLPNMPENEIESALVWKLRQNPPAGTTFEGICFDYLVVSGYQADMNKELQILVFAASKEMVMEQVELFRGLSLELIAVEPKPYAALNALFWLGSIHPEETALVLQLGAAQSAITIMHTAAPKLMRPLAVCGNSFSEAISNYHRMDFQQAEQLKIREGLSKGASSACLAALSSQLESLVVDIEHTFKYFSHQLMKSQINSFDHVILCGGSALLKGLDKFLSERLEAPVEVFNPFSTFNLYARQELSQQVKDNAAGFSSVLGLAARNIEW
ncbi:MAG: hypothetical protein A3G38_00790 [Omnitrophica WOR_2 bacterium RIFCSPLOWO2_12_FULL_51_8]|nr:MAG: hypothetical protein A3G38_00790 [Omnitrophica WOR_2 bacterium RIFCSPLOWO2_12_FULL_51_8]